MLRGIFHHEGQKFAEQGVVHLVDFMVMLAHVLGQFHVARR